MKRIAAAFALVAVVVSGLIVLVSGVTGGGDPYDVHAIFDNASFVALGEDVRIAGAPVGSIVALGVCVGHPHPCAPGTLDKAAVTLEIDNSAFAPFHANATCTVRLQSLIGEKYIDCTPGTSSYPALSRIRTGPGTGSYLLPVTQTSSPVDFDLVQDIYQEPVAEQFALILNELGTGLAARGSDLNAVIRRADPALGYTDKVLKILAAQNRQLAQLATDSRQVLVPLARERNEISGFVVNANRTSVASAARATDIQRSIQLLPSFLRQLRPLMADLGSLAGQATPVFSALSQAAPSINRQFEELAPFARQARTALINLGNAAAAQQPALIATIPLAQRLERLGSATAPAAASLDQLLASFQSTGGIQQLMALLFNGASATNGFDADGHYVRTSVQTGSCTAYAKAPAPGCSANFKHTKSAAAAIANAESTAASEQATLLANDPSLAETVRKARAAAAGAASTAALTGLLHYLLGSG